jgi:hypothetical protein
MPVPETISVMLWIATKHRNECSSEKAQLKNDLKGSRDKLDFTIIFDSDEVEKE